VRRFATIIAASIGLVLLAGCAKTRWEEYTKGYMGKARYEHYLAARILLEDYYGYDAERTRALAQFPDTGTTVIIPAHSISSAGGASRYRRWVERGGHLIYLTSSARPQPWDNEPVVASDPEADDDPEADFDFGFAFGADDEHPLLDEFGIGLSDDSAEDLEKVRVSSKRLTVSMDMSGRRTLDASGSGARPDVVMGKIESAQLLSLPVGSGRLTVFANDRSLRNRYLSEDDNARLLLELVQLHEAHAVRFIYGEGTSFMAMLAREAWMPLIGLGILTLLWIWKNLPRFGPVIPQIDGGSRQFTEHIEMGGRFLWRHKSSAALLAPLVSSVLGTFHKKFPHLADSRAALSEYLGENTQLSSAEISEALLPPPIKDPATMTRIVRNLKHIKESL